ncbi:MAG TPA: NAD(P)-binding domain-containing protein [Candidatus Corynebacterium avicola]|uniref:NAD(P)-binding domain-containing protein n=1 Tax=Candidatus Corynebacterium avicola TaxID=2838527 RepID=A0A9D1RRQ7_9CORY|nr:NAD(P)-binding domain-containing protein [Candidatus Corynebacterium avicola]
MGRYCIIGAGAAGLSAVKLLRDAGYDVDCFEKADRSGGHWNTDYDALHLITARDQTHFPDFPMPEHYPHFPSRNQVVEYIHSFADHFDLHEVIHYSTAVVSVSPVAVPEGDPVGSAGWEVVTSRGDEGVYDGVLVANGHLWDAKIPEVARNFTGYQVHTSKYRNTSELEGERVLVVGAGNSGCDMAVDVAQSRMDVDIVIRKGVHFQPKMYFGIPRSTLPFLSEFTGEEQDLINRLLARVAIGENKVYPGLPEPESRDLAGGATIVNDLLLYWIQHGRVAVRPGIERIEGKTVFFSDGSAKEYDSIIWATGFNVSLPFLDDDLVRWQDGAPVRYAGGILPEGAEKLYFVGLAAPRGPQIPVYGEQTQRILRMLALQEGRGEGAALPLSAYFQRVQEPETRVDLIRHVWNDTMADTDTHLRSLENMDALGVKSPKAVAS